VLWVTLNELNVSAASRSEFKADATSPREQIQYCYILKVKMVVDDIEKTLLGVIGSRMCSEIGGR